jgi:hypothetical protein
MTLVNIEQQEFTIIKLFKMPSTICNCCHDIQRKKAAGNVNVNKTTSLVKKIEVLLQFFLYDCKG